MKMKAIAERLNSVTIDSFMLAAALAGTAFAMVAITYGLDSMFAGAHDTFHDFRHAIGMACH